MVDIPLVGACEASLHLASMLGHNFSVIVNFPTNIANVTLTARSYGFEDRIKSFRSLDMSTIERGDHFHRGDPEQNRARLIDVARKAVEIDGAEVIVGACTSAGWFELGVQEEIGVPVVDPALAAVKTACFMADLYRTCGLSHSRVGGYFPRGTFFG
jgi:allantoin racemase